MQLPPSSIVTSLTSKGSHSDSDSGSSSGSGLGTCSAVASCALCSDFLTHFSSHTFYIQSINANVCVCVCILLVSSALPPLGVYRFSTNFVFL